MGKVKDLIGQIFGELTVVNRVENSPNKDAQWLCKCSCGKETIVPSIRLTHELTRSCGHLRGRSRFKNLSNMRFGNLVVIKVVGETRNRKLQWLCHCDCGNDKIVIGACLTNSHTTSCGCIHRKIATENATKHGLSNTLEYKRTLSHKHREASRNLDCEWTTEMEIAISELFPICVVCGSDKNLETDHVKALSKGFGLKPGNAVKLCRPCNSTKNNRELDKLPSDMREKIVTSAIQFKEFWMEHSK